MIINYEIDKNQSILNKLIELLQELDSLDQRYILEVDAIQSVYQSPSGKLFLKELLNEYSNFLNSYSAFCKALEVFANIHELHLEASMHIDDEIAKIQR